MRYALSLKQPWAALLISRKKTIEVRKWPTTRRGIVLIHAARIPDNRPEAWKWVTDEIRPLTELSGGILGVAELTDCRTYSNSELFEAEKELHLNDPSWFQPPRLYGFVFAGMELSPFQPLAGNIRFFPVRESEGQA